jgi:N-glycosidase YbiA
MMSENTINFYSQKAEYGCFSNFYMAPINIGGKTWRTTEHYFQAQKFAGTKYESHIRNLKSPNEAAMEGRRRDFPLRRDWESVKDNIMLNALRAKFTQHPDLKKILLDTGDAKLIEHTEKDSYWGDGGNGKGKNMLGILLMQIRSEFKNKE